MTYSSKLKFQYLLGSMISLSFNPTKIIQPINIGQKVHCHIHKMNKRLRHMRKQRQNFSHPFNNLYENTNHSTHILTSSKPNKTHFNHYNKPNVQTHHNQWNSIVPNSLKCAQMKKPWHIQTISSSNLSLFRFFFLFNPIKIIWTLQALQNITLQQRQNFKHLYQNTDYSTTHTKKPSTAQNAGSLQQHTNTHMYH